MGITIAVISAGSKAALLQSMRELAERLHRTDPDARRAIDVAV
jgi:hypothetical protein